MDTLWPPVPPESELAAANEFVIKAKKAGMWFQLHVAAWPPSSRYVATLDLDEDIRIVVLPSPGNFMVLAYCRDPSRNLTVSLKSIFVRDCGKTFPDSDQAVTEALRLWNLCRSSESDQIPRQS